MARIDSSSGTPDSISTPRGHAFVSKKSMARRFPRACTSCSCWNSKAPCAYCHARTCCRLSGSRGGSGAQASPNARNGCRRRDCRAASDAADESSASHVDHVSGIVSSVPVGLRHCIGSASAAQTPPQNATRQPWIKATPALPR